MLASFRNLSPHPNHTRSPPRNPNTSSARNQKDGSKTEVDLHRDIDNDDNNSKTLLISHFISLVQEWGSLAFFSTYADVPGTPLRVLKLSHSQVHHPKLEGQFGFGFGWIPLRSQPGSDGDETEQKNPNSGAHGWVVLLVLDAGTGGYRRLIHEDDLFRILVGAQRVMGSDSVSLGNNYSQPQLSQSRSRPDPHPHSHRESHSYPSSQQRHAHHYHSTHSRPYPQREPDSSNGRLHYSHHYSQHLNNPHHYSPPRLPPISTLPFPPDTENRNVPSQSAQTRPSPTSASSSSSSSARSMSSSWSGWGSSPPSSSTLSKSCPSSATSLSRGSSSQSQVLVKQEEKDDEDDEDLELAYPDEKCDGVVKREQEEVQPARPPLSSAAGGHQSFPSLPEPPFRRNRHSDPPPPTIPMVAPIPSKLLTLPSLTSNCEYQPQPSGRRLLSPFQSPPAVSGEAEALPHAPETQGTGSRGKKRPLQDIGNFDDEDEENDGTEDHEMGADVRESEGVGRDKDGAPHSKRSRLEIAALTEPSSTSRVERPGSSEVTRFRKNKNRNLAMDVLRALAKSSGSGSREVTKAMGDDSDEEDEYTDEDVPLYIRARMRKLGNGKPATRTKDKAVRASARVASVKA